MEQSKPQRIPRFATTPRHRHHFRHRHQRHLRTTIAASQWSAGPCYSKLRLNGPPGHVTQAASQRSLGPLSSSFVSFIYHSLFGTSLNKEVDALRSTVEFARKDSSQDFWFSLGFSLDSLICGSFSVSLLLVFGSLICGSRSCTLWFLDSSVSFLFRTHGCVPNSRR